MTTFDEQMAAIEQIQASQVLGLPYTITDNGVVLDSHDQRLTTRFTSQVQDAYLVACANAAPDLVAEIRRLREGNAYLMKRYTDACMSLSEALERVEELEGGETA